jgi:hypothetical protein
MSRPVMVVFPEPVPPQIPIISGLLSSGRIARASEIFLNRADSR